MDITADVIDTNGVTNGVESIPNLRRGFLLRIAADAGIRHPPGAGSTDH